MNGTIFDIQKFSIHDGPGIRTTVFLKGCPLRCLWCHNPESQSRAPEMAFTSSKCVGCGSCVKTCPASCHSIDASTHVFNREGCSRCGLCAKACYAGALELVGRKAEVSEVIDEVMKDSPFYESSGGGMTLSGGEPFFQPEFSAALLAEAKARGLHCCVETCGFAAWSVIEPVLKDVDLFLFDVKESDPARHEEFTGVPLKPVMETLERLDKAGAKIILRCPVVPGLNDRPEHFRAVAELSKRLQGVQEINLMPYHPLGVSKAERFGLPVRHAQSGFPSQETVQSWIAEVARHTSKPCLA